MKGVGLWWNYPYILIFQHRQCCTFYGRTWRCASFLQKWTLYETCHINLWLILTWRKWHVESNYCNWWNLGTNVWNGTKEAIKWMASTRTQVSTESISHEGHNHFGIWQPRYSRVSPCSWGLHCQCHILQIISAVQSASYTAEETFSTYQCNNPPW